MTDLTHSMPAGVRVRMKDLVRLQAAARGLVIDSRSTPFSPGSGSHRSSLRGRGLEFDEVRIYQPGDDVRSIDWRVTARRGKPHTKVFREERERPVLLLVDMHPGMFFGTRVQFKSVLAARVAAIVLWAAVMAGDSAGGVVAGGVNGMDAIPARPRQAGVLGMLHAVSRLQPNGPDEPVPGRMDAALSRLRDMAGSGSLVILLSDFREMGSAGERHIRSIAMRNDVMAAFIYDLFEKTPPPPGRYRFGTPGRKIIVDTSLDEVAGAWSMEFTRHRERLGKLARGLAVRWVDFSTDMEPLHAVATGFTSGRRIR